MVTTGGPRHVHIEGFDLHASTAVGAGANERLENLCRYILRPPVVQDALELTPEGKVLPRHRRPWRDRTRALCFEPSAFLPRLAAMIPRLSVLRSSPATEDGRINLLLYHGAFGPRGRCHSGPVVVDDAPANGSPGSVPPPEAEGMPAAAYVRRRTFPWADLLRRVFEIDILACPDCGGRLGLLATIEEQAVVKRILTHLGLPADPPCPSPARTPEWLPGVRGEADHEHDAGGHQAD